MFIGGWCTSNIFRIIRCWIKMKGRGENSPMNTTRDATEETLAHVNVCSSSSPSDRFYFPKSLKLFPQTKWTSPGYRSTIVRIASIMQFPCISIVVLVAVWIWFVIWKYYNITLFLLISLGCVVQLRLYCRSKRFWRIKRIPKKKHIHYMLYVSFFYPYFSYTYLSWDPVTRQRLWY